ncbi:SdpI/YhfL protein family protein [Amycolatopsis arida]|uniref:SdpI/YhfL protein family protein n=1 Tax=Amycolatopsis arida TaxID=587909 RepID=A0A1I5YYL0_9PSEU|nr:SdpI family protein [Amycolatopsis arida]TDX89982.1 SdpI/YhfL family protein [Amycolatopsis arida]SFQ49324.1 SdpI/YhfL protein family protein [Amycolatopsis arida]
MVDDASGVPGWALVVILAVQVALGVALFLTARLGASGRLRRNPYFGLRTPRSLADDAAWDHVHRKAAPVVRVAFAVVVVGTAVLVVTTGDMALFITTLLTTDVLAVVVLLVAVWIGHRDLPRG